jgi:L-threonylcarbamoyladenylate synthase
LLCSFAEILNDGGVVAFPTETFYGLLARLDRPEALRRIFELKGRAEATPLPVIAADVNVARSLWREIPALAPRLTGKFWPGPLTLVAAAHERWLDSPAAAGTGTIGVRVPGSAAARGIAAMAGGLVAATSANPTNQLPAMSAAAVHAYFGDQVAVAAGPALPPSRGSTVLLLTEDPPRLLRDGDIPREAIEATLGLILAVSERRP